MTVSCSAPSKLILSGEHSVLYGCPALSMAIDLPTRCEVSASQEDDSASLQVALADYNQTVTFSFETWRQRSQQIETRFQQFNEGHLPIEKVIKTPLDLIVIALYRLHQQWPLKPKNWHINLRSDAPAGRGLGSSASVIMALLQAMLKAHRYALSSESLLALATEIESYQHGASSGLDPATLMHGGLLKYRIGQPPVPLKAPPLNAWLIDSGEPQSSTGECVEWVKKHHQHDQTLWQRFTRTTETIENAWLKRDWTALREGIDSNQRLLTRVGVVPDILQPRLQVLKETLNASVKLCGAGSLRGEQAGMIFCLSETPPTDFCQHYGYRFWPLHIQTQGVQCETTE